MIETPQPSLTERVASAAAWNTLLFPVQFVVGLVASVLMLNYLQPAEYGVLALLTGLTATIGLYADLGIERSLPRFIPEVERREGRAGVARFLWRVIGLKLFLVLICIVVLQLFSAPLVGRVVANEQVYLERARQTVATLEAQGAPADKLDKARKDRDGKAEAIAQLQEHGRLFLWAVGALVLFGAIYDVFMAFLTAYFKQRAWNIVTAAVALLQPLLVISFIALNWHLGGVLLGMVITPVIAVALAAWQTARASRELAPASAGAPPDPLLTRRFLRYAGMSFLTQLTTWFYDVAFVVFVLTAQGASFDTIALLSFAYTFAKSYLSYAYLPFGGLLTPLLARIRARHDPAALQETYGGMTRLFALLLIPAGVGLALLTPRLLALLYPRYTETTTLAYLFIAFTFAESLLSVPHNVLMVYERYQPVLIGRLLALIVVPLLMLLPLLAPEQRLFGAALAVGFARVLPRIVALVAVHRSMGLRFPGAFVGRVIAATTAFGVPLLLLPFWPLPPDAAGWSGKAAAALSLGALAALGGLGYLLALRLLGGLDEQERKRILSLKLPFKRVLARLL
jgi:O-antigen/teichoic acid export membrane protein